MTKEQEEYIGTLADSYNREVEVLHIQEMELQDALFKVKERQKTLEEKLVMDISEFMTTALEEQKQEIYQKYRNIGINTDGMFFKFIMLTSRIVLFLKGNKLARHV